jgi:hypothetical protein
MKTKREAEQVVADLVLSKLPVVSERKSSAKEALYAYCGSHRFSSPVYEMSQVKDKSFRSVVVTSCIQDSNDIEVVSDEAHSESIAVDVAIDKAISFLEKLPADARDVITTGNEAKTVVDSTTRSDGNSSNVKGLQTLEVKSEVKDEARLEVKGRRDVSTVCGRMESLAISGMSLCPLMFYFYIFGTIINTSSISILEKKYENISMIISTFW